MVFERTTRVYERIHSFNSKWVRKKEKYANSKWILRNLLCCCSNLSNNGIIFLQKWYFLVWNRVRIWRTGRHSHVSIGCFEVEGGSNGTMGLFWVHNRFLGYKVVQETGSKFVSQNSPIVPFDTTSTQSLVTFNESIKLELEVSGKNTGHRCPKSHLYIRENYDSVGKTFTHPATRASFCRFEWVGEKEVVPESGQTSLKPELPI